ncbi:MAG: sn-glycerol-1-phosphate dehydrogenase [Clostridiales bacterium]|nr:sn-glycerol-1-phosphate dehydrogenase [Clostridiales bacterium]
MRPFADMTLEELIDPRGHACACGQHHAVTLKRVHLGQGALGHLPASLEAIGVTRPFVVCDQHTRQAAWEGVKAQLDPAGISYGFFCFNAPHLEPDEKACGALTVALDPACDGLLAVGSGVLNDICKVVGFATGKPCAVVATAPSMDGYASDNASMIIGGVKVSLYNACPQAIIADTDILCAAPERMLQAGLGDMLAKYVSICEWRLSNLVTGEYYCENIAGLMRASLKRIVEAAPGLLQRDARAVSNVFEGLLLAGIAMAYAKVSRPASGLEHYFSHMWEMMALERGRVQELHGIQVGIGTLLTLQIWEHLKRIQPDRARAEAFIHSFDEKAWEDLMRRVFGGAADKVIATARAEGRNDSQAHARRLDILLARWPDILRIAEEELPSHADIHRLMASLRMPMTPRDIGFSQQDTADALLGARDIRNKYLTSSMLWDLGLLYEVAPGWLQ